MKKKIAVTGGIGSGKSAAIQFLADRGFPVFSCDEIYKEIIVTKDYIEKIGNVFPSCIKEGWIDRKTLAKIIFNNPDNLTRLNNIAHPLIMESLFKKMKNAENEVVFAEVPLLFEGNYEDEFDGVIVILRNKEKRIQSVMQRDGLDREQVLSRMQMQFNYDDPKNRFDKCNAILIYNNEDLNDLKFKIENLRF